MQFGNIFILENGNILIVLLNFKITIWSHWTYDKNMDWNCFLPLLNTDKVIIMWLAQAAYDWIASS